MIVVVKCWWVMCWCVVVVVMLHVSSHMHCIFCNDLDWQNSDDIGLCLATWMPLLIGNWRWGLKPWVPHAFALLSRMWCCIFLICDVAVMNWYCDDLLMLWWFIVDVRLWSGDLNKFWTNILFIIHLIIWFDISPFLLIFPLPWEMGRYSRLAVEVK